MSKPKKPREWTAVLNSGGRIVGGTNGYVPEIFVAMLWDEARPRQAPHSVVFVREVLPKKGKRR